MKTQTNRKEAALNDNKTEDIVISCLSTGKVKIKKRFEAGKGLGIFRKLRIPFGKEYTPWLPVHVFLIDHPEGKVLVDTGEITAKSNTDDAPQLNNWFIKNSARFSITQEEHIDNILVKNGVKPEEIKWVIPTHLHQDHMDGLVFFKNEQMFIHKKEYSEFFKPKAGMKGYIKKNLPPDFKPNIYNLDDGSFGPFKSHKRITSDGRIVIVPIPGHTLGHVGICVDMGTHFVLFSGDLAFKQENMLNNIVDGVAAKPSTSRHSYKRVLEFASQNKVILMPAHDINSEKRLAEKEYLI